MKLRSFIGQKGGRATPETDVAVHQDVGDSPGLSGEFGCDGSEHVRTGAETIREKENVRVSSSRGRPRPKVVDADRDGRAIGQGYSKDWPANGLAGGFASLAFHEAAHPPFRTGFHVNRPVEAL